MLSIKSMLKVTQNGKDYTFTCDPDSPLQDAVEACSQHLTFLSGRLAQTQIKVENPNPDISPETIKEAEPCQ